MKTIFLFLLTIAFCSCSSNKTEDQIKDYIKQNINDPASYEPVSFSEQQPDSTTYTDDGIINMLEDSIKQYQDLIDIYKQGDLDAYDSMLEIQGNAAEKESKYLESYKNKPDGYKIKHIFRRKNKAGGVVLDSINFRFDSSMMLRDIGYKKQLNKD